MKIMKYIIIGHNLFYQWCILKIIRAIITFNIFYLELKTKKAGNGYPSLMWFELGINKVKA